MHNLLKQKQLSFRAVIVKTVHYYSNSDIHPRGEVKSTDISKDDRYRWIAKFFDCFKR